MARLHGLFYGIPLILKGDSKEISIAFHILIGELIEQDVLLLIF